MKIGAMNNPRKDIYQEINRIASQEFDFIDLTYEWPCNQKAEYKKIRELTSQKGLEIIGHSSPSLPVIYPVSAIQESAFSELKKTINFFAKLGVDKLNVHPFYYTVHSEVGHLIDKNLAVLKKFAELCAQKNIKPMLENYIYPFDNTETIKLILDTIPEFFLHLDVGHLNFQHGMLKKLEGFTKLFGGKIIHCHLHDNNGTKDDHLPLGCGSIKWPEVIKIIKDSGYNGTFTLEVFSDDHHYLLYSKEKLHDLWKSTQ